MPHKFNAARRHKFDKAQYRGFMARTMALCSLPRTNPGNQLQYKRTNGPFTLGMIAGLGNALGQRVRSAVERRLGAAEMRELNRIGVNLNQMALASPVMAVWSLAVVLLLAAGRPPLQAQDQTPPGASYRIDTFAGGGSEDGGPADQAALSYPVSVATDGAGNLYVSDEGNHRVRRIDTAGVISTIAGTGERGFSGDDGPATEAQLSYPDSVAVDGAGNVYIADFGNTRIRKVDAAGVITTVAGTGERGFGGDGGPATEAQFSDPKDVALDGAGNLYVSDGGNHRVRRIDTAGVISTIAGTGEYGFGGDGGPADQAALSFPRGVATDGAGNLYVADDENHRVRRIDTAGVISTIAGTGEYGFGGDGGPATEAQLFYPDSVAVDGAGNVYIADFGNARIRKVDAAGVITTVAGTGEEGFSGDGGPADQAALSKPRGVAVDSAGNVYIADLGNQRVRRIDTAGVISTIAGTGEEGFSGDGDPATEAQLSYPASVAVDSAGNVYVAGYESSRVRRIDTAGVISTFAGTGEEGFSGDGGPATEAQFYPGNDGFLSVATDAAGNVYVTDPENHRVRRIDTAGVISTFAGTGEEGFSGDGGPATEAALYYPVGVAVDSAGNVYVADLGNQRVRRIDTAGVISTFAGTGERGFSGDGGPATEAQLSYPASVAVDSAGNVYVAGYESSRVRRIDTAGVISTFAGTGEEGFSGDGGPATEAQFYPGNDGFLSVATDAAGNVYVTDPENHRVRRIDTAGVISTFAGTGEEGFSGDGGPATEAALYYPVGVAVDGLGNVYIADTGNQRIRKLTPGGGSTPPNPTGPALTPGQPAAFRLGPVDAPMLFSGDSSFQVEVPEGASRVTFTLESIDPDVNVDLYVRYGEDNAIQDGNVVSDYSSEGSTGNEQIVVTRQSDPPLRAGTYFVSVLVFDTGVVAEGTVRAEFDTPLQTGDQIYYFPHLAVGASWQTTITYINYSSEEVRCQTDFISDHGTPLMVSFADKGTVPSRTDVLLPGGSVHQETNVELNAPFAPGWARATCSGPVKASLLFRLHNSEGVPIAEGGVNAAAVPATRFVTFAEQGEGKQGTGVAYANPSATEAVVTFTARDADGQMLASVDKNLSPNGHAAQNMAPLFALSSFTGSLEVTSTAPIVSLSINAEAAPVFSSLPPGELDAAAQGSTTYYFPHLAVGQKWQTTITYINYSSQEVRCQTDFISDHGTPLMVSFAALGTVVSRTDVLLPGGSVHQETNVELNAPFAPGWARATCSGPVKASLLFRLHNSEGVPIAEGGVNAAAVPATRFVTFAEQGEGQFGTGVAYANPSPNISVPVTFTARDTDGEVLASVVRTLLPGGHDAHGMAELFGFTSFTGSIEVTSTEPIVSLSINAEAAPVFSSLPPGELEAAVQ